MTSERISRPACRNDSITSWFLDFTLDTDSQPVLALPGAEALVFVAARPVWRTPGYRRTFPKLRLMAVNVRRGTGKADRPGKFPTKRPWEIPQWNQFPNSMVAVVEIPGFLLSGCRSSG